MAKWKIDLAENFPLGESSFPNPTLPGVVVRLTTRNSIGGRTDQCLLQYGLFLQRAAARLIFYTSSKVQAGPCGS